MASDLGFTCSCCGQRHDGLPLAFSTEAPVYWTPEMADDPDCATELWEIPGGESEQPYFGWLSTELPIYSPSTINLKTNLHTRPIGQRPLIELEPTDHPLAVEQRNGITMARVQQIAEALLHPGT